MIQVTPLFAIPILTCAFDKDIAPLLALLESSEWEKKNTYISKSRSVLKEVPFIESRIKEYLEMYSKNMLGQSSQVQIVTSWFTKSEPGSESQVHSHTNSWLSGVMHLSDNTAGTRFFDSRVDVFRTEYNDDAMFGKSYHDVDSISGQLVLFPSHLKHQVLYNFTNETRYSMSFNALPFGRFGDAIDSTFSWPTF